MNFVTKSLGENRWKSRSIRATTWRNNARKYYKFSSIKILWVLRVDPFQIAHSPGRVPVPQVDPLLQIFPARRVKNIIKLSRWPGQSEEEGEGGLRLKKLQINPRWFKLR